MGTSVPNIHTHTIFSTVFKGCAFKANQHKNLKKNGANRIPTAMIEFRDLTLPASMILDTLLKCCKLFRIEFDGSSNALNQKGNIRAHAQELFAYKSTRTIRAICLRPHSLDFP